MFAFTVNPLYAGVSSVRDIVLNGIFPTSGPLIYLIITSIVSLIIGIYVFYKYQDKFVLNL